MSANRGAGEETAAVERRPTPLDPYPQPRPPPTGEDERPRPIDLGPDAIAVLEGRTFMYSDSRGDVAPGSIGGLVHEDTRFVSRWELRLDGRPLSLLKSGPVDYDSAAFFLTNPDTPRLRADTVAVRRLRLVGGGALEQIAVSNTSSEPISCELRLLCGADFADLFEIKSRVRDRSGSIVAAGAGRHSLRFRYQVPGFLAETTVRIERSEIVEEATEHVVAAAPPRIDGTDAVWALELPPRCLLLTLVKVGVRVNNVTFEPVAERFGGRRQPVEGPSSGWLERIPRFEATSALLTSVVRQSVVDLAALRITGDLLGESYVLPAAGLPWFMTLFGRDTLITSLQTVWVGPGLARGALHLLGALQGMQVDDFRDEEPGKILHEVRSGELTRLGEMPHSPYYGTADATPLWLILLSEYWRFTGQDAFVLDRWDKVAAALAWIDRYGDRDGDGYVEYQTRSRQGLGNQCWKDSWDGVQFADGTIPNLPIATAEIQGYVYDAKLRVAELARRLRADIDLAERLEREAEALYGRFNDDFWSDDRGGYYVVGLDGDKRRIDSLTSNIGHLLWSGIVPKERAGRVARPAHVGRDVLGLGRPHVVDRRSRLQPDRLPHRHDLAARQFDRRTRARARGLPRRGEPDRPGAAGCGRLHGPPASGGVRGLRALGQPLSRSVPHGLQPPGVGHCGSVRLRPGHARSRGPRRRASARPARARGDRSHRHSPPPRIRGGVGCRGGRRRRQCVPQRGRAHVILASRDADGKHGEEVSRSADGATRGGLFTPSGEATPVSTCRLTRRAA